MSEIEFIIFIVGLIAGMINSIAGGGSFLSFPALVFAGLPPIIANATNTFAATAGYFSGAYAFRNEIRAEKVNLVYLAIAAFSGGIFGALLLMNTSNAAFEKIVPWLMAVATFLFIFGNKLNLWLAAYARGMKLGESIKNEKGLYALMFLSSFYGGYFNAGQGIIILAFLVLLAYQNIHFMNGIKLTVSALAGLIAIGIFIYEGAINFHFGLIMLVGNLLGGYLSAHISRFINPLYIRWCVIIASIGITLYFFYDVYF